MEGEKSILKDKKFLTSLSIAIGVILVLVLIVVGAMSMFGGSKKLSLAKAQEVASKYIDETLLQGQIKAKLSDFKAFNSDLFVFKVEVQGQTYDSYITKDGKWLFPQAYEIKPATSTATTTAQVGTETQQPTAKPVSKNDKPVVELFVMSYCPYGTQAEKGILPAVKALGNKIDFKLKFVAYTMHGDKETQENLLQYCINKVDTANFYNYLNCFLGNSDSAACLKSTKVNTAKVNACVTETDSKYKIAELVKSSTGNYPPFNIDKEDNVKYGVQGSPTLVINGSQVESGRDSVSFLKTICSAFNTQPEACKTTLSSATPAPGFGSGTTNNAAAASCE